MKVTVEYLYHFNCEACSSWFSIGDAHQALACANATEIRCPYCGEDAISVNDLEIEPRLP